LPSSLLESELFGYEEGAFTGASRKGKYGLFELAHGGTIFLDEIDSLPIEMEDSARVDGANTVQVLMRILFPLLRPGIIATGTWVFIAAWDEYLYAYTMIANDKLWPNSVGLASYIGQYNTPWNEIMSGAVLVTLPVVFMFMYFQKHIVRA
jgi:multiple sugar transport system permease protein